jgi:hypothetical protein
MADFDAGNTAGPRVFRLRQSSSWLLNEGGRDWGVNEVGGPALFGRGVGEDGDFGGRADELEPAKAVVRAGAGHVSRLGSGPT